MELKLATFLIVCPLVFLAGFVDAIGGGGGLISLPAYLLAGVPVHFALATNKMSSASIQFKLQINICQLVFILLHTHHYAPKNIEVKCNISAIQL